MSITANHQFEGPTIEDALESAVSTLGDDLEILDAHKVQRRGLLGLRRQELFEVTAARKPTAEPKDFEDVLARMVDRVDEAERSLGADLSDTDRRWWSDADFVVPTAAPAKRPAPSEPTPDVDLRDQPAPEKPTRSGDPAWSSEALLELGLPPALVARAVVTAPKADLEWVTAIGEAIADLIDTAKALSGPCELTGHGAASVVQLLRGACDGFRLDSLIIDGRRVPATPMELSLAIRALLTRELQEVSP